MIPYVASTPLRRLTANEMRTINDHIDLLNNQRAPLIIDLRYIADLIREIAWDV